MARHGSPIPRLLDIIQAIGRVRERIGDMTLPAFAADWESQWIVERGIEIISEASRHLPDDLKARHAAIPWSNIAGIGNILRHNYERIAAPIMWTLARDDLALLLAVCEVELVAYRAREAEK